MIRDLDKLVDDFKDMMGEPILSDGTRKAVIIMVSVFGSSFW